MSLAFQPLLEVTRKLPTGRRDDDTVLFKVGMEELFPKVDKSVDGEDCDHACESCSVRLPRSFKIVEEDALYGHIKGWETHILVATGKTDWVRDVADEKGSVMQAIKGLKTPTNGKLMLSASNMPTPHHAIEYSEPTQVLLLPAFTIIENVTPASTPLLIANFVEKAPTNTSPLAAFALPRAISATFPDAVPATLSKLTSRPCPHSVLILLCSQKTRDARCGQSAPLLRQEFQRHLQPLSLYRDLDDERPGGVGIYFISHVGGHKYSANVMVYRRPDPFGLDGLARGRLGQRVAMEPRATRVEAKEKDVGAAQCIWLARVKPEDCEGIVKFTVLQGKVIKPESQLRGGFDRAKGLLSW